MKRTLFSALCCLLLAGCSPSTSGTSQKRSFASVRRWTSPGTPFPIVQLALR